VPIIVAINKIDKPGADVERAKQVGDQQQQQQQQVAAAAAVVAVRLGQQQHLLVRWHWLKRNGVEIW
jgi:translation initiation factor IF-2